MLEWWFSKGDNMIDEIDYLLSSSPYAGKRVEEGPFITYGKSQHRMLNYLLFYIVNENEEIIDVINILPSRSECKRIS